jgi:hypothetical protein
MCRFVVLLVALCLAVAAVGAAGAAPASPAQKPLVLSYTVKDGKVVKGNTRPTVKKGRLLRIVVVSNRGDELHLHGYDFDKALRPNKPVAFQFRARLTGRFELELHHPDIVIARLSVRP